nr:MAG TPA: hypothetical protein [Bacteriophage sp.]
MRRKKAIFAMIAFYMGVIIGLKGGAKCCTSVLLFIVLKCK